MQSGCDALLKCSNFSGNGIFYFYSLFVFYWKIPELLLIAFKILTNLSSISELLFREQNDAENSWSFLRW